MNNRRWNPGESLRPNRWLLVLLGAALAIHFLMLIPALKDSARLFTWPDGVCYERVALNILDGNGYSLNQASPYTPNSTMVPGYPLFIAGIYAVFGRAPYAVVIIQVILSLGLIAVIMCWGARRFSERTGLLAGIFLLFNLCFVFYSAQIMSDILFLCFFLPALWFVFKLIQDTASVRSGLGAGIFFGLAALTRPIALYFPLLILFLFIVKRPTRGRLAGYGVLLLAHIVVITPWFVRNRVTFGRLFFSTVQSFNLSHIHAAPIKARIEGKTIYEAESDLEREAFQTYGEPKNEAEGFIFTGRKALRYILKHPGPYAVLYASGIAKTFLPMGFAEFLLFYSPPPEGIRNLTPWLQNSILKGRFKEALNLLWEERIAPTKGLFAVYVASFLFNLFLIGLAIRGFLIKGFRIPLNFLAFLVGIYFIGVTGPAGQPRHFLPLLPLAALLAAHALVSGLYPLPKETAR